jgi:protocatechuate 3,4-dioxygenase beta subunit
LFAIVISGTVVDAHGRPVRGARVFLTDAPVPVPDIAALTDADGRFELTAPAPGSYTVGAASDVASASTRVTLPGEGEQVTLRVESP